MQPAQLPERHRPGVYQLEDHTVSPTVQIDIDEDGLPKEATVNVYARHELFVDVGGNVCDVSLSNSRVYMGGAEERYGQNVRVDWIRAGGLPMSACPYAPDAEVKRIKRTISTLLPVPKGVVACDGKPDGCDHLHAVIAERRAKALKKWEKQELSTAPAKQMDLMARAFGTGFAQANAQANATSKKAALSRGQDSE